MINWIMGNVPEYNSKVISEEDLKIKVIIPFLESIGYNKRDFRYENSIEVVIGSKKSKFVFSDIEVLINDRVEMVIDVKKPTFPISEKAILQSVSYAKLISTPSAIFAITTNGKETTAINITNGIRTDRIPTKEELLREVSHSSRRQLTEIEIREVKSVLLTLMEPEELYKVIRSCKDIIEKKGLIRTDQSFKEMTKILLVKMNEERRVKTNEGENRFSKKYIELYAGINKISFIDSFEKLFSDAKIKYPKIYNSDDERLQIRDDACLQGVVEKVEPFSFLGTGDDIKGAVYEIFLKATLRGEFDQYFTPREIVDFIVQFADPNVGDVFIDPACGSGGFLIQAFNHVNKKITSFPDSEVNRKMKFQKLVDKSIWGNEADYDLHVLAKINLIMHGDGWNNIYQGDTLISEELPNNYFDLVMTNPPFTISYNFPKVLSLYELGIGKEKEELDILFIERSLQLLKPGHDMYIVLPEGLLNLPKYYDFRKWLLRKAHLICSISLPEGAFIPFGGSVSKTCILGLRKVDNDPTYIKPKHVFLGRAIEIGYETGKKTYKKREKNDLVFFLNKATKVFEGIESSENYGECGWIVQNRIDSYRLDACYLLNSLDRSKLLESFNVLVPLKSVCRISNLTTRIHYDDEYYYLEVPDISEETGMISNIRKLRGEEITSKSLYKFFPGDILFTRINPRKSRIAIVPPIDGFGVVSKEVYRLEIIEDNGYISQDNWYALVSILQSSSVRNQIVRLSAGSSSSRARVLEGDLTENVYIPIPAEDIQSELAENNWKMVNEYWDTAQRTLRKFVESQSLVGTKLSKDRFRTV